MSVSGILTSILIYLPKAIVLVKVVLLFFIVALFISIIVVAIRSREYLEYEYYEKRRGADFPRSSTSKLKKKWRALEKQIESKSKSAAKLAIIEADKIIDDILDKSGYQGETMAERLEKVTEANISNIEDIWKAHRLRNTIVHDMEIKVSRQEIKKAFKVFTKTLEELEAF